MTDDIAKPGDAKPPAVTSVSVAEVRKQEMDRFEEEIFQEHYDIVRQSAMFKDVDPAEAEPRPEFAAKFSTRRAAENAYRLARSGWLPPKDAPSGVKYAYQVALGIMKLRADAQASSRATTQLNVAVVINNSAPKVEYETVEVDE